MRQCFFYADYDSLCAAVAEQVVRQLRAKPDSVLVFPTGNTPLGLFSKLVEHAQSGNVDFSFSRIVILDEYAGLAEGDPRSLTDWLKRELLSRVNIDPAHIYGFGEGPEALERQIASLGGLDLVILGLGPNGHLGFNEPGSPFESRTRRIELAPASITSNAAYWGSEDKVPRHGFTLGLGTISEARHVILMVSGAAKRDIFAVSIQGAISPDVPASFLKTMPQAQVFADEASKTP
jgi:glucosamine-6-phosphate deaminase